MKNLLTSALLLAFAIPVLSQDNSSLQASGSANEIYVSNNMNIVKNSASVNYSTETKQSKINSSGFRYYFFPNMSCYFDTVDELYIYKENGTWKTANELPSYYGGYSMFKGVKVRLSDYIDDNPEQFVAAHRKEFPYNSKGRFTYKIE